MNGAPAKPISGTRVQLRDREGHPVAHRCEIGRIEFRQRFDVGGCADGCSEHRTDAGNDIDSHAGQSQRNHDVGEEDARRPRRGGAPAGR